MLEIRYIHKSVMTDSYENGADPYSAQDLSYEYHMTASTPAGIIDSFKRATGCDEVTINPTGDEPNRIEASRLENGEGYEPTPAQLAAFKAGKLTLYIADYTAYVETVTRIPADLTA